MIKHTPGPWKMAILTDHDGPPQCDEIQVQGLIGDVWERIAECDWHDISKRAPRREQAEANAILMAAAPDLLEALMRIVESVTGVDQVSAVNEARAAISKATGCDA